MTHSVLIVGGTRKKRKDVAGKLGKLSQSENSENSVNQKIRAPESQRIGNSDVSDTLTHRRTDAPSRSEFSEFDTAILEPEDDKRTITIDQIRRLQHQLSLKPYAADRKNGIVFEAQRMTVEAQNALLKTLEEPPPHSALILTAPSARNLLPTIVSRCQITRLPPAIDLDVESDEYKKGVEEFLKLLRQGRGERLAWVEENKKIFTSLNLLDIWTSVLRDLLLTQTNCSHLTLTPHATLTTILPSMVNRESYSKRKELVESLQEVLKIKRLLATTNVSPRLAIEVLLLDLL